MNNQLIQPLLLFLKQVLETQTQVLQQDGYSNIICQDLPFDVIYYLEKSPFLQDSTKKIIHINHDQFVHQQDKILNRLKVMAAKANRIYARETILARIDKKVTLEFQTEHHLQIPLPGKYRYGLFHQGELVSIAVFSGGRTMKSRGENHRSFELLRFCHKSSHLVVGGLSKLLQGFITDFKPNDIMTYVDMDWSQDSSLKKIGFTPEGQVSAQKLWIDQNKQFTISDEKELERIKAEYPYGYLIQNQGSMKLVLYI